MSYEPDTGNPFGGGTVYADTVREGEAPVDEAAEFQELLDSEPAGDMEHAVTSSEGYVPPEADPEERTEQTTQPAEDEGSIWKARALSIQAAIQQAQGQLQAQQEAELRETDPEEFLNQKVRRLEQAQQHQQMERIWNHAVQATDHDEAEFSKSTPDYHDALDFARNERARLLRATHPDQPEAWVTQTIENADKLFALQSLKQGVSPAARAYDYAVRLGYGGQGQGQPAGRPTYSQPAQPARPTMRPTMTSLSAVQGRGGMGRSKYTAAQVANLDLDVPEELAQFDRIMSDENKRAALDRDGVTWL